MKTMQAQHSVSGRTAPASSTTKPNPMKTKQAQHSVSSIRRAPASSTKKAQHSILSTGIRARKVTATVQANSKITQAPLHMAGEESPSQHPFWVFTKKDNKIPKGIPAAALSGILQPPIGRMSAEAQLCFGLWRVALLEAGKVVVANHFGLEAQAYLVPSFQSDPYFRPVAGRTFHRAATPLQASCILWAGAIMEHVDFDTGSLAGGAEEILGYIEDEQFSNSDVAGMFLYTKKGNRAFRTAYKLLHDNRLEVMDVARNLFSGFWDFVKSIPPENS